MTVQRTPDSGGRLDVQHVSNSISMDLGSIACFGSYFYNPTTRSYFDTGGILIHFPNLSKKPLFMSDKAPTRVRLLTFTWIFLTLLVAPWGVYLVKVNTYYSATGRLARRRSRGTLGWEHRGTLANPGTLTNPGYWLPSPLSARTADCRFLPGSPLATSPVTFRTRRDRKDT